MELITSTQNKRVKYVKTLQNKARLRRGEMRVVLEGNRLLHDALQRGGNPDLVLYTPDNADYHLIAKLQNQRCELVAVSDEILQYVSDTQQSQGIIGVFHMPRPPMPQHPDRILILDGLSEPGNLGTILRTAGAAGVDIVILSPGCVDPYNPKAMRAGMGAHFIVPIVEAEWNEIQGFCQDIAIYATRADADISYTSVDWTKPWAFIVGNEAHGISQQARRIAETDIAIPMASKTESLNAAIASAVILFEAQRQRLL